MPKLSKSVFSVFVKKLSVISAISLAGGKGDIRICGICVRIKAPLPFGKGWGEGLFFVYFVSLDVYFRCFLPSIMKMPFLWPLNIEDGPLTIRPLRS